MCARGVWCGKCAWCGVCEWCGMSTCCVCMCYGVCVPGVACVHVLWCVHVLSVHVVCGVCMLWHVCTCCGVCMCGVCTCCCIVYMLWHVHMLWRVCTVYMVWCVHMCVFMWCGVCARVVVCAHMGCVIWHVCTCCGVCAHVGGCDVACVHVVWLCTGSHWARWQIYTLCTLLVPSPGRAEGPQGLLAPGVSGMLPPVGCRAPQASPLPAQPLRSLPEPSFPPPGPPRDGSLCAARLPLAPASCTPPRSLITGEQSQILNMRVSCRNLCSGFYRPFITERIAVWRKFWEFSRRIIARRLPPHCSRSAPVQGWDLLGSPFVLRN